MAIVLRGLSTCPLSGRTIQESDEIVMFPAFIGNKADPLYSFSDGAFMKDAFMAHPLAGAVMARYTEHRRRTGPGHRKCVVTGEEILDVNDYFGLPHLTDDPNEPLFAFNYLHVKKSALSRWQELPRLVRLLEEFQASGRWAGDVLKWHISVLRPYLESRPLASE